MALVPPFQEQSTGHIASVVEEFVKAIDERITCLVTDAGKEWHNTAHRGVWICVEEEECDTHRAWSAMARLDRTVRTLRWYMFHIWLYKGRELTNWYELIDLINLCLQFSNHFYSKNKCQYFWATLSHVKPQKQKLFSFLHSFFFFSFVLIHHYDRCSLSLSKPVEGKCT